MGVLCVEQEDTGGELGIALRDDREFDIDQVVANAGFEDEAEPSDDDGSEGELASSAEAAEPAAGNAESDPEAGPSA